MLKSLMRSNVSATLRKFETDYRLHNIAYIWAIKNFKKKDLPDGKFSGIIYDLRGPMVDNLVLVYTTDTTQGSWADDIDVLRTWKNPKHVSFNIDVSVPEPLIRKKKVNSTCKVAFEDIKEQFFMLRDNSELSVKDAAASLNVTYAKYNGWLIKYKGYSLVASEEA